MSRLPADLYQYLYRYEWRDIWGFFGEIYIPKPQQCSYDNDNDNELMFIVKIVRIRS